MGEISEGVIETLRFVFLLFVICIVFVAILFGMYYYISFPWNAIIICVVLICIALMPSIPRLHDA